MSDALAFARHALADAYERLKTADVDQRVLDAAFGSVLANLGDGTGRAVTDLRQPAPDPTEHDTACRDSACRDAACQDTACRDAACHDTACAARAWSGDTAEPGGPPDPTVRPPIPDLPGVSLRPDPGAAGTIAEFLECLRNYRLWAGSPSFRVMSKNCDRRFAPSTICTALGGGTMPGLEMVLAIVAACGGPQEHRCEFATAWRRLVIPRQEPGTAAG